MCNVEPNSVMSEGSSTVLTGASCRKCLSNKAKVVLQHQFPYCKDCFAQFFSHKFRSTLGKSKLMKHGDRVLLAFSGSQSCICLLHLINQSASDVTRRKRIHTDTEVVFIDDLALAGISPDERIKFLREINEMVEFLNFSLHFVPFTDKMEKVETHTFDSFIRKDFGVSPIARNSSMSITSVNDFVSKLRLKILHNVAEKLECNKIFTADTSDHIAVNLIANISLGRGNQLPSDIGFCDQRFGNALILRPLIECSKKEIVFYNRFMGLGSMTVPDLSTKGDKLISIQRLTEQFITNLGENFPSTVATVVSTGAKLTTDQHSRASRCLFCEAGLEVRSSVSASEASKISSRISCLGPQHFDLSTLTATDGCPKETCECSEKGMRSVFSSLCYGCSRIVREAGRFDFIRPEASLQIMRSEIQDFLL